MPLLLVDLDGQPLGGSGPDSCTFIIVPVPDAHTESVGVEISEIHRASYRKRVLD